LNRQAVTGIQTAILRAVQARRQKSWLRGEADLKDITAVFDEALRGVATRRGKTKIGLCLEGVNGQGGQALFLVLGDDKIPLDRFECGSEGAYPVRAVREPEAVLDSPDAVLVRILGHFLDPKSSIVELLDKFAP